MARPKKEKSENSAPTSLKAKLLKNSMIKESAELFESNLFDPKDFIVTDTPGINLALSGDCLEGGLGPGIFQIAAESKHFKSKFALKIAKHFMEKFPEGAILFYDSEYGTPESYFDGMNTDSIIHCPILDLEEFKQDIVVQLQGLTKGEKLLIIVDSLGNIPSLKELADAEKGEGTQDMTRAKNMKSVFRMIMPLINQKEVYMIAINHIYKTIEMYSKDIPTGGTGSIYNSNVIWTITKAKEKEKEDKKTVLTGYNFTINIYKSRFVKEETKIPITVKFDGGIEKWSGMLDLAEKAGYIERKNAQTYYRADKPEELYSRDEIEYNDVFMTALFADTDFNEWIKKEYKY